MKDIIVEKNHYQHRNVEESHEHKRHHNFHVQCRYPEFIVITMVSNPMLYDSRYKHYRRFKQHMLESGAKLFTVELQQRHREFQITQRNDPYDLQLRTDEVIWLKENALNLAINRIATRFPEIKYFCFVDADVEFTFKDWIERTINALQVYDVVQPFQTAINLGPNGEALSMSHSFMSSYILGKPWRSEKGYGNYWHPGFAIAFRKRALSNVGLLIDQAILGSGDFHMCTALIGKVDKSLQSEYTQDYKNVMYNWQRRAEEHIKRNVGYVPGNILHGFHGTIKSRGYNTRYKILIDEKFEPNKDLSRSLNGLYQLDTRRTSLRDKIRAYFASRNEDSIDLECL